MTRHRPTDAGQGRVAGALDQVETEIVIGGHRLRTSEPPVILNVIEATIAATLRWMADRTLPIAVMTIYEAEGRAAGTIVEVHARISDDGRLYSHFIEVQAGDTDG
jgi:hypothetical protein